MSVVVEKQCRRCRKKKGQEHEATVKQPSYRWLKKWESEGCAYATDGCKVEPDGICEHGHDSWLIELGMI